jgi:hypothetical protein
MPALMLFGVTTWAQAHPDDAARFGVEPPTATVQ